MNSKLELLTEEDIINIDDTKFEIIQIETTLQKNLFIVELIRKQNYEAANPFTN